MAKSTYLIIFIILGSVLSQYSIDRTRSVGVDVEYQWIWDDVELNGAGDRPGDDVIYYGESMGAYYNSTEIRDKLFDAQKSFPDIVDVIEIGKSYLNKSIYGAKLTAPRADLLEVKYETVVVGNHHAREAITVVDTLLFMDRVLYGYYDGNPLMTQLLEEAEIYIVPTLNPDGLDALYLNPWIRKNLQPIDDDNDGTNIDELEIQDVDKDGYIGEYYDPNYGGWVFEGVDGPDNDTFSGEDNLGGVDLNRNYPYEFDGSGSSTNPADMTYRGPSPLSAPETSAWAQFAQEHSFFTSVSLHSGIEAIISPWGFTGAPTPDEIEFDYITDSLQKLSGFPLWEDLPNSYKVNGEWGDWMYGALNSLAVTFETYGNEAALKSVNFRGQMATVGIWDLFNPPSKDMLTLSKTSTQPMIDFMAQYPMKGSSLFHKLTDFNLTGTNLYVAGIADVDDVQLKLQYRNERSGWTEIDRLILTQGEFNATFDITGYTGEELRVYAGLGSRGLGYTFSGSNNLQNPVINIPYENNTISEITEGTTNSISSFTVSPTSTTTGSTSLSTTISSIISSLIPTGSSTSEKSVIGFFGMITTFVPILYVLRKRKNS